MKVNITKRYCYSQSYTWAGGFARALQDMEERQADHPGSELALEVNERSTSHIYRVVRYTPVEIEVPDMPLDELPKPPKAKKLRPHEYTQSVSADEDRWGYKRHHLTLIHTATGELVRRHIYGSVVDKYVFGGVLKELERKVDPTYGERHTLYKERLDKHNEVLAEWRKAVDAIYAEAKKEVVVA